MERVEETGVGDASSEQVTPEEHLQASGSSPACAWPRASTSRRWSATCDLPVRERFGPQIERILREGLGSLDGAVLRLNERGLDLHSEVSLRFF